MTKIDFLKIIGGTLSIFCVLIFSLYKLDQSMIAGSRIDQTKKIDEAIRAIHANKNNIPSEKFIRIIEAGKDVENSLHEQMESLMEVFESIAHLVLLFSIIQIVLCIRVYQKLK